MSLAIVTEGLIRSVTIPPLELGVNGATTAHWNVTVPRLCIAVPGGDRLALPGGSRLSIPGGPRDAITVVLPAVSPKRCILSTC